MTVYTAPVRPQLSGARDFTWYTPAGRLPSLYEDLTVHQQSSPEHFAVQGWPIRFDDGRDPYAAETTAARSSDWYAFRDPNRTINRTYISGANESEKALERSIGGARDAGLFSFAEPRWVEEGLSQAYMTYPFVEYGLFLALCYAEREALSDTTTFPIVFTAADKLRHLQDIVHYSFELAEVHEEFSDDAVHDTWKNDPVWQGARAAVERINALTDWVEIVIAINLSFDRIFGEIAKVELFSRFAAANGDVVTPIIIASSEADSARTLRWTKALATHLLEDPEHGAHNRALIMSWLDRWNQESLTAAEGFEPLFSRFPQQPATFASALTRVQDGQTAVLKELNLL